MQIEMHAFNEVQAATEMGILLPLLGGGNQ